MDAIQARKNAACGKKSLKSIECPDKPYADTPEKRQQEINSLIRIPDSFKKIVVVREPIVPWTDENGICYVGIREFLCGSYSEVELV